MTSATAEARLPKGIDADARLNARIAHGRERKKERNYSQWTTERKQAAMHRARLIFSAASDLLESPVMNPQGCGVQRSSSRTCSDSNYGLEKHTSLLWSPGKKNKKTKNGALSPKRRPCASAWCQFNSFPNEELCVNASLRSRRSLPESPDGSRITWNVWYDISLADHLESAGCRGEQWWQSPLRKGGRWFIRKSHFGKGRGGVEDTPDRWPFPELPHPVKDGKSVSARGQEKWFPSLVPRAEGDYFTGLVLKRLVSKSQV